MGEIAPKGFLSLVPVIITLLLAFMTKYAVFSLVIGCIKGHGPITTTDEGMAAFIFSARSPDWRGI
jgi:hypothetical protein